MYKDTHMALDVIFESLLDMLVRFLFLSHAVQDQTLHSQCLCGTGKYSELPVSTTE